MKGYAQELLLYAYLFFLLRLVALAMFVAEEGYTIDFKSHLGDVLASPFTIAIIIHTIYQLWKGDARWVYLSRN